MQTTGRPQLLELHCSWPERALPGLLLPCPMLAVLMHSLGGADA